MNNNLTALNNTLFAELEKLTEEGLSDQDFERALSRSRAVTGIADRIIHSGELSLQALQLTQEYGVGDQKKLENPTLPPLLEEN